MKRGRLRRPLRPLRKAAGNDVRMMIIIGVMFDLDLLHDINKKIDAANIDAANAASAEFVASLGAGLYVIAVGTAGILLGGRVEVARGNEVRSVQP
jgi:hypothetical protein